MEIQNIVVIYFKVLPTIRAQLFNPLKADPHQDKNGRFL